MTSTHAAAADGGRGQCPSQVRDERRTHGLTDPPLVEAANTPILHAAFDQLVGTGRWYARDGLGSFPLRFPHPTEPDDAGWHVEGSYTPLGATSYYTNVRSRDRLLLMLFLFTSIDADNAPTRVRVAG